MKKFVLTLAMLCMCSPVWAGSSAVWWPGWNVSSSEELYDEVGHKYSSYPLPLMFDNDPKTAWVYSAKSKDWDKEQFRSRYGIDLKPERPITIDSLRIMNGQNASRARFLRNNRVLRIRVTMNEGRNKVVRTFNLPDRMGWHTCALPRRAVKRLKLEFIGIRQARDNDLCVSELALFNGSRKINLGMPRAVMFNDGLEGCGANYLITRAGKVLDGIATDVGYTDEWSPNGRYVAGTSGGGGDDAKAHVWVADVWKAEIVRRFHIVDGDPHWLNNRQMQLITYDKHDKRHTRLVNIS
ncbi:MAG TPA: hypothetical protein VF600_15380 [Abditibacteriaceae bacterium]|jgi:hypothetical protein